MSIPRRTLGMSAALTAIAGMGRFKHNPGFYNPPAKLRIPIGSRRYKPNGPRECARRCRQIASGVIPADQLLAMEEAK